MSMKRYEQLKGALERERALQNSLIKRKDELNVTLKQLEDSENRSMLQRQLLEEASDRARTEGMNILADTATNAVQSILGDDTSVEMVSTIKRGVPQVDVVVKTLIDDVDRYTDPTDGEGGGVADIVSLAMFFSLGLLVGQDNEAPLFLDEPTKFLSAGFSADAAKFINDMVEYTEKQTFMVTHDKTISLSGDKVFQVKLDENKVSRVTEVDM